MKKLILGLALALAALAANVTCPKHTYASCYDTGQIYPASGAHLYHCSCGDEVWSK